MVFQDQYGLQMIRHWHFISQASNGKWAKREIGNYTTRDLMKGEHDGCVTVTLKESTSCVDLLENQLNYISVEVMMEV